MPILQVATKEICSFSNQPLRPDATVHDMAYRPPNNPEKTKGAASELHGCITTFILEDS